MRFEIKKDNRVYCTFDDVEYLPDKETIQSMKEAGYKLYEDGKLYKTRKNKE